MIKQSADDIIRVQSDLAGDRCNWENHWQQVADFCLTTQNQITVKYADGQIRDIDRTIDVGIDANDKLANGLYSHLINLQQETFRYRAKNERLNNSDRVKNYFMTVTRVIRESLLNSNFILENHEYLRALCCFGTAVLYCENGKNSAFNFKNYYIKDCYIQEDNQGYIDSIYRKFEFTLRQAIQEFGLENLSEKCQRMAQNTKNLNKKICFIHAVYPRFYNPDEAGVMPEDKLYASAYVEIEGKKIVREGGYDTMPYHVARFLKDSGEVYGRSPAMQCLASLKMMNTMKRDIIIAAEQVVNPQWLVPNNNSSSKISQKGGAIIYWESSNPNNRPERLPPNGEVVFGLDLLEKEEEGIRKAFFNDMFDILSNRRNMTATEVVERIGEKLVLFNPVVGRIETEYLKPLFERLFTLALSAGILPPLPQELEIDPNYEIDFKGKLSLAMQADEITSLMQTYELLAGMSQMMPGMLDNLEPDKIARDVIRNKHMPEAWLRSEEEVAQIREQRAMAQQQQQQMEQALMSADIASKTKDTIQPNSVMEKMLKGQP